METIRYQQSGAVARIRLNRPKSLNAITEQMILELHTVLVEIAANPEIRVVVVSGEGRAFSAGIDLKATSADGFGETSEFMRLGLAVGNLLANMPKVTIAQVHGYCFTGALELMLFFDMAFCTEDTQFGDTHAKFAIMPRWGMSQRLARRVGLQKAKELTFRALRVAGIEAERIGLVNRAFKSEELEEEVNRIIEEIIANNAEAIAGIKRLYNEGYQTTLAEGLKIEWETDPRLSSTAEYLANFQSNK